MNDAILAAMNAAHQAAIQGQPERWFILTENPPAGLKLGIGMFNHGIFRVADICYIGKPSDLTWDHAWLIVDAVNACRDVNSAKPGAAAKAYPELVAAAEYLLANWENNLTGPIHRLRLVLEEARL